MQDSARYLSIECEIITFIRVTLAALKIEFANCFVLSLKWKRVGVSLIMSLDNAITHIEMKEKKPKSLPYILNGCGRSSTIENLERRENWKRKERERKSGSNMYQAKWAIEEQGDVGLMIAMGLYNTHQHNVKTTTWKQKWENKVYTSIVLIKKHLLKIHKKGGRTNDNQLEKK